MITLRIDRTTNWDPYGSNAGHWWSEFFYTTGGWAKVPAVLANKYNATLVFDKTESTVDAIAFNSPADAYRFIFKWVK